MAWYFHVIQRADARWACRHGLEDIDDHPTMDEAVEHCLALAVDKSPATVIVHHPGGAVERIDPQPAT